MVYTVEHRMASAQVQALATTSKRGREMAAGLPAFREEGTATAFARVISSLCSPPGFSVLLVNLPHHFLHLLVAGTLRPTKASLLLKGCWLWAEYCPCSARIAGASGKGMGLTPGSQHRMRERKGRMFSIVIPSGWDMSPSGSRKNSVRGPLILQPKCRGLAEGCTQGREDQR